MSSRWARFAGLALLLFVVPGPSMLEAFGLDATAIAPDAVHAPWSLAHPLGTDELGRDVLARLALGGRISLGVALLSALFAGLVGGGLGLFFGYFGGLADRMFLLGLDAFAAVPRLPLLLLLLSLDPVSRLPALSAWSARDRGFLELVVLLSAFGWVSAARLARASAKRLRDSEGVLAARALGASELRILRVHVLPSALGPLSVAFVEDVADLIVYESALSFLGLGIEPPTPSWGAMLGRGFMDLGRAPALVLLPGLGTAVTVLLTQSLGVALRQRLRLERAF